MSIFSIHENQVIKNFHIDFRSGKVRVLSFKCSSQTSAYHGAGLQAGVNPFSRRHFCQQFHLCPINGIQSIHDGRDFFGGEGFSVSHECKYTMTTDACLRVSLCTYVLFDQFFRAIDPNNLLSHHLRCDLFDQLTRRAGSDGNLSCV